MVRIKQNNIKKIEKLNYKYIYQQYYNIYNILLILLFITFSISKAKLNSDKLNKLISNSEILLTIKGTNRQQILYWTVDDPTEIYVNGNKTNKAGKYNIR